ncbi:hypothetical protein A2701_02285 [Candidatus Amesbacteria bacterium RIFCSPHIGHO2_01_FULL_47_34]|uniref:Type II secretion system protein GspG C-terminal domain-containing protein n=1 Tax=Candidatus Amesbacteria bacterium RIFCSPLOWO2_01_FULL_47_33 TaxID=1797258 RepID=A0A1F4Z751_9BACT|nr:MAG: hypothetical protein A2701_02285 [Candidatus Amesbacteria bacterium RIFCSPHIGHO2_01_FULL_47_34]OGD01706.1 MAG: hypothetical protein A2972_00240 [Candidatus Amesbacteria bacterium RIFCSPLOWO2_01_FULL_47_33]
MFWLPGILPAEEYGDTICIVRVFKRGFTLIELLVVIGVLAVIAAGVVALINPQDKIAQANDTRVLNDIGQYGTALQAFASQNNGLYPDSDYAGMKALIQSTGELTVAPDAPAEYAPYEYTTNAGADARICGQVKAKKYVNQGWNRWRWDSGSGKTCAVVNCADACP